MNISRRPLVFLFLFADCLSTVPESKRNQRNYDWSVVSNLRSSIGRFVGVLVSDSWELGHSAVEGIRGVWGNGAFGHGVSPYVVEGYSQAVIFVPYRLHQYQLYPITGPYHKAIYSNYAIFSLFFLYY